MPPVKLEARWFTRDLEAFTSVQITTNYGESSQFNATQLWNSLKTDLKALKPLQTFKG